MAHDAFGGFNPGMQGPSITTLPSNAQVGEIIPCVGSPEGSVQGAVGWQAQDQLTGDFYVKIFGTGVYGWVKTGNEAIGGGGGGTTVSGVTSGNGSPMGVVDPAKFVIYIQLDSSPPGLQWWSNGTTWQT